MKYVKLLVLAFSFLSIGCTTMAPIGSFSKVPIEQKQTCSKVCSDLDMKLGAMVVISNMSGCVCEVKRKKSKRAGASAATGGAVAAILAAQQQQLQSSQSQ